MWICLKDAFFSIVFKDCPQGSLLVRARREGDIEKVFGVFSRTRVTRSTDSDYLFRAVVRCEDVAKAVTDELQRIDYANFKSSVKDKPLHDAYMSVWSAMASLQNPRPYSAPYKAKGPSWPGVLPKAKRRKKKERVS